jgi:hypothetical protein
MRKRNVFRPNGWDGLEVRITPSAVGVPPVAHIVRIDAHVQQAKGHSHPKVHHPVHPKVHHTSPHVNPPVGGPSGGGTYGGGMYGGGMYGGGGYGGGSY